jgi:hypothetical protein
MTKTAGTMAMEVMREEGEMMDDPVVAEIRMLDNNLAIMWAERLLVIP